MAVVQHKGSLSAAFAPTEVKRLAVKLEIHHTPRHSSWLNMAEFELSALQRQCLRHLLPDRDAMQREVGAWTGRRINGRFTTDALVTLRRLDPTFED